MLESRASVGISSQLRFSARNHGASVRSGRTVGTLAPEPLLDDQAIVKQFDDLDGKITDHVINYWHSGEISSKDYQAYINSAASRHSWSRILFQGRALLGNLEARVHMFRAILAYHVYSCIADWKILTSEQRDAIINETRLHVPVELRNDELHKASLESIAMCVFVIGVKLGSQKDDFKFDFRNKDNNGDTSNASLGVRLLGQYGTNSKDIEVVNETEGTIRALISPGVIRVPSSRGKGSHLVRKAHLFAA
ncbi:hypothetical protein TWF730_007893 [Orbilia blumenaviensis]|uniref:Uncharacterized protein n=1 Tax=Orbilia blumenaviensis TaxID=1796055 RepID=A0AAV9VCF8_9PEZI